MAIIEILQAMTLRILSFFSITICFLLIQKEATAQFGFEYDDSPIVLEGSNQLDLAWAGGLNYVQISDFDYDLDGDLDLFLFDRSKNNIRVYTQELSGSTKFYKLAYNAAQYFPNDVIYRATLVDYDNDGKKDLFTYGIGGLKVYRNISTPVSGLQWELFKEIIYSDYPNLYTNLYVSSSDIPAIIDVDFDGDIDVLTFHQGGQHVEYHQNQSMELYGIPDSLSFILKNECWGKFSEDLSTNSVLLNDPNTPCSSGDVVNPLRIENDQSPSIDSKNKHSGSTLLAMDYDNSGVMDLIIGDVSFTNLVLLLNGGTAPNQNSAMVSQDAGFPSNSTGASVQLFPAAFFVDVDFDGIKDLVVAPNAKNISENESSVRFYKNNGSNSNPNFIFTSSNLFQNEMIDHGTGSIPVLFDYNQDGLKDLAIANFHRYKPILDKESTLALYKNTGTNTNPTYTYVDFNYLNLNNENYGLRIVPAFGDIDNDGDQDMFLGRDDGTLVYYINNASGGIANFQNPQINYTDNLGNVITTGGFCHPQLFDLNEDGKLDLILGAKNGEIKFYQNIGTTSVPSFELRNNKLGNIDVSTTTPDGYAAPHFFKSNGKIHLFLGSINGNLIYFDSIENNLETGSFHLISDKYLGISVDAYSSFFVDDIDNDGNLNMFVGQDLGGLYHFEANPGSSANIFEKNKTSEIKIYPNPSSSKLNIINNKTTSLIQLMDLRGRSIFTKEYQGGEIEIEFDISFLPEGSYFLIIESIDTEITMKRFVKN